MTSYCCFYEATGIAVEFDNVAYDCDRSVGFIKIITELKETAKFLGGIQSIINAFSVREKHHSYYLKTLDEAISLVSSCDEMLSRNIEIIKLINGDRLSNSLNGPEGSVSAVTICSIKVLLCGLNKLKENRESFSYNKVNLLSCMTLSAENLHSAVNRKQGIQTLVFYAQDLATTIKESIKAVAKWSAHYVTSREQWYPLQDSAISLASFQSPKRTTNLSGKTLNSDQKREIREWASVNGAVVWQQSCRQKAMMARQEPFQRTHILRSLHQFLQTKVQTQMNNQWKRN